MVNYITIYDDFEGGETVFPQQEIWQNKKQEDL